MILYIYIVVFKVSRYSILNRSSSLLSVYDVEIT